MGTTCGPLGENLETTTSSTPSTPQNTTTNTTPSSTKLVPLLVPPLSIHSGKCISCVCPWIMKLVTVTYLLLSFDILYFLQQCDILYSFVYDSHSRPIEEAVSQLRGRCGRAHYKATLATKSAPFYHCAHLHC